MATMTDIAREAGVSLSTVSYALSGKRPISAETRERIQSAIARLEYHPTAAARALASRRTSTLGVAVPQRDTVDARVIMEFVSSILASAHLFDHDVLLVAAEDSVRTRRVMEEGKVDALILMDLVEDDPRIPSLAALPRPVVLIGKPQHTGGLACVDFDFLGGAQLAVHELYERGARNLAMIVPPSTGSDRVPTYSRRSRLGYTVGCSEVGVEARILEVDNTAEAMTALVSEHLASGAGVDGLFVHHESALPTLARALSAAGLEIPSGVQVVAIAPADVAESGPWRTSGIDLPIPDLGRTAVTMALELVANPETPRHSRLLSPAFVPRATTRD